MKEKDMFYYNIPQKMFLRKKERKERGYVLFKLATESFCHFGERKSF